MKLLVSLSLFILFAKALTGQTLPFDPDLKPFYHGVASGDPLEDRVIIWTRITPDNEKPLIGSYMVATDTALNNVVKTGIFSTDSSRDYTVKIDVTGLQNNTTYYYAFSALGKRSPIGRTKTTPSVSSDNLDDVLKFAVASCANYEGGYFNAYARIAERNDLNAVIHLGDYYYEYAKGSHRSSKLKDSKRSFMPVHEPVTKADYRLRQSLYHLDKDLQKLHRQHPFIVIWDDHEVANNAYETGAKYKNSDKDSYSVRKMAAKEAYLEWMPIRGTAENSVFYRAVSYGKLLDLFILDTRLEGRQKQPTQFHVLEDTLNPRKIISPTQESWLINNLKKSTARWKVVGSQVIFSNINLGFAALFPKSRNNVGIFQNLLLDNWGGYLNQRNKILDSVQNNKVNNLVIISGDSHSSWAFDVNKLPVLYSFASTNPSHVPRANPYNAGTGYGYNSDTGEGSQGVEFSTPSISSLSFVSFLTPSMITGLENRSNTPRLRRKGHPNYNPHLKYVNFSKHGYFVLDVRADSVQCDYFFVPTIAQKSDTEIWGRGLSSLNNANKITTAKTSKRALDKAQQDIPAPAARVVPIDDPVVFTAYLNPTADSLSIQYGLNKIEDVDISVVSEKEEILKTIVQIKNQDAGIYSLSNIDVSDMQSGIYFLRIKMKEAVFVRKLIIN